MFASLAIPQLTRTRSSSSSSTSSTSSTCSLGSPLSLLAGQSGWCPTSSLKSCLSPPSTTTAYEPFPDFSSGAPAAPFLSSRPTFTVRRHSLSPPPTTVPASSTAYPSWPLGDSLHTSSASSTSVASMSTGRSKLYISDDELLGLSCLHESAHSKREDLNLDHDDDGLVGLGISWSQTRQPEVPVVEERERRPRRLGPAPVIPKRRRSRDTSVGSKNRGRSGSRGLAVIRE